MSVVVLSALLFGQASQPSQAWRKQPPAVQPTARFSLPAFEEAKLENGLRVLVTTRRDLPIVRLSFVTRGGAALDPAGYGGLTQLTYQMLEEGTVTKTPLQFSDAVADLGASFASGSGREGGTVSISGLARHTEALVSLLAEAVLQPRLAGPDFDRLKANALAGISAQLASPQGLAFLNLPKLIYGKDHPYGHPPAGDLESVGRISVQKVKAHYRKLFAPERSALVAVGDISLSQATKLAEAAFGAWQVKEAATFSVSKVPPPNGTPVHIFHKAQTPQTMIVMARPIFAHGHPDQYPLTMANRAFGGAFSSRLNLNLREDKGYSYGAGSQVSFRPGTGVFVAYSAVKAEYTIPSLKEFYRELDHLQDRPIEPEELEAARTGLVRSLPGKLESLSSLSGVASTIFLQTLPLDYLSRQLTQIEGTKLADAQRVSQSLLRKESMVVLMVGDKTRIVPLLKSEGLGPYTVHDVH